METSTVMRNVGLLQEILSGKSFADCAKEFNMSIATVANSIRSIIRHLKEYTHIEIEESSSGYDPTKIITWPGLYIKVLNVNSNNKFWEKL